MAKAKARTAKKAKKPRITITLSAEVKGHLQMLAAANQRSVAWIINYAIEEILEKNKDNPTLHLPARSSPHRSEGGEER
jgi:CopG antitoxin of type II toxin-antitoxin system